MTLRQKSIIISVGISFLIILAMVGLVNGVVMEDFQEIENQRVEKNIRRVSVIIDDQFSQINAKLADWTIWDDTYDFLTDHNKRYIENNLTQESFAPSNIDEALFIDKKGALVEGFHLISTREEGESNFPQSLYHYFATGSALLKINPETGFGKGLLRNESGLLFFVVREVVKSDGGGEPSGNMVFTRHVDNEILNSMQELSQFKSEMFLWNDSKMSADYLSMKDAYVSKGETSLVRILDKDTISGYVVVKDIYGEPQAIIRTDMERDITKQGRQSTNFLIVLIVVMEIIFSGVKYGLLAGGLLKRVLLIANDVDNLGGSETSKRLEVGKSDDEVDRLRGEINKMLDSLETEKQKGESLIDLVNAIVVMLNNKGEVLLINKKGLEILGYQREEILGKNWFENFLTSESQESVRKIFGSLLSKNIEENSEVENEILTKDGKRLLISWHNTVLKNAEGKIVSTLSLGEDITVEKTKEIEKEKYAKELERLNRIMVGRELKMMELKKEINNLKTKK